jgi:hypothetical protein
MAQASFEVDIDEMQCAARARPAHCSNARVIGETSVDEVALTPDPPAE